MQPLVFWFLHVLDLSTDVHSLFIRWSIGMCRLTTNQVWCIGLLLALYGTSIAASEPTAICWHVDVRQAWQKTLADDQPMLLLFTMDKCRYCTKMKRSTYTDDRIVALIERSYVPVVIDGFQWKDLTRRLGIRIYPTTVILSPENRVIDQISGFVNARQLHHRLALAGDRAQTRR